MRTPIISLAELAIIVAGTLLAVAGAFIFEASGSWWAAAATIGGGILAGQVGWLVGNRSY